MKAMNAIYFHRKLDFYFEFIPQITLMLCLFGWMDLLIIVKWVTSWDGRTARAPGIVSTMISMFLNLGSIDKATTDSLIGGPLFQQTVSITLLLVALVCIPSMLLVKPYFLYKEMKDHEEEKEKGKENHEYVELKNKDELEPLKELKEPLMDQQKAGDVTLVIQEEKGEDSHNIGEIFIHQLIETIEFALGTVSNTASYLRLWALSLAHGQLADVFFEKLLRSLALSGSGSGVMLFFLFPIFASFSFFVLMCMDSMECFLHTLRLHWVEFQNKFYKGNGFKFVPFSFTARLEEEINASFTENITIQEEEDDGNHSDPDDRAQELEPTIDQLKKKKEENKNEDDDEDYAKTKLYNELRKAKQTINLDSLKDAKERVKLLSQTLKQKQADLVSANIEEGDPEDIVKPNSKLSGEMNTLEKSLVNLHLEIEGTERAIVHADNILKSRENLKDCTTPDLEQTIAKCKNVNTKIGEVLSALETTSLEQGATLENVDKFLVAAKASQLERLKVHENEDASTKFDARVNF